MVKLLLTSASWLSIVKTMPMYFFGYSGNTMKFTNGEFTETTHSTFKISERQHNFHVNRMLGTPVHKEKAMKSIVWHNTRKAGFTPPLYV